MKTFSIQVVLLIITKVSFSQVDYFNYLDYSSQWKTHSGGVSLYFTPEFQATSYIRHSYSTTYFDGDTLISGKNYYKRRSITKSYFQTSPTIEIAIGLSPYTFIREDIDGNFYEFDTITSTENLILDNNAIINLAEGENFAFYNGNCSIENIDTIIFNGRPLFYLKGLVDNHGGVVEGIGVIESPCFTAYESFSYLACYSKLDNVINFSSDNCSFFPEPQYSSNNIKKETKKLFSISPNPSNSDFTIKFAEELTNGALIITNQLGEIVQSYSNLSGNEIKIEKGALSPGIYFVSLKTDKTDTCFQKLILNN